MKIIGVIIDYSQKLQASNILDNVYATTTSVILEGELTCSKMQAAVGNTMENYNLLLITFEIFWKKTCQQQKVSARPKRQATLTDMFLSKYQLHCSLFLLNNSVIIWFLFTFYVLWLNHCICKCHLHCSLF